MRWDLTEQERRRAERNAGLSGAGFNIFVITLCFVAAFCFFMVARGG